MLSTQNFDIQVFEPRWADAEQGSIECVINCPQLNWNMIPFCARPDDVEPHGRQIFAACAAGAFGDVGEFIDSNAQP